MSRDDPERIPGGLAASFVDQALLSAATLAVAAIFVMFSSKVEFAVYSLVWASVQLASSVQNAVVLTPFLANIAYLKGEARDRFILGIGRFQLSLSLVGGLVAFAATLLSTMAAGHVQHSLAVSAGIALLGGWAREFRRTSQFADLQPAKALHGDVIYVALLAVLILVGCLWQRTLTAAWALSSWGLAGLLTGPGRGVSMWGLPDAMLWRDTLREQVRWTLPSVVLSWIQSNAYNFAALAITGIHSVADVNTARLFASPLSLLQAGWNRVYLPSAAVQTADGRRSEAIRSGAFGVLGFAAIGVLYAAVLLAAAWWGKPHGMMQRIVGLESLVLVWVLYQLVAGTRGIGTSLMVVQSSFARLFQFGFIAAVATVAAMFVTGSLWGLWGLLVAMITGEGLLAVLIWSRILVPAHERRHNVTGAPRTVTEPVRTGDPSPW